MADLSSYGLNVSASGGVQWDANKMVKDVPPEAKGAIAAASQAMAGNDTAAINTSLDTAAGALVALFPYGTLAAGAIEGFKAFMDAAPKVTTYFDWDHAYGKYDPGPPGSFQNLANTLLRKVYDDLMLTGKAGGTLGATTAAMGITLGSIVKGWNDTHEGPQKTIIVHGANPSTWGGPTDPIGVAATGILFAAHGPHDVDFPIVYNAGPAKRQALKLRLPTKKAPASPLQYRPAKPAQKSPGKKSKALYGVLGGFAVGAMAAGPIGAVIGAVAGGAGIEFGGTLVGKVKKAIGHG